MSGTRQSRPAEPHYEFEPEIEEGKDEDHFFGYCMLRVGDVRHGIAAPVVRAVLLPSPDSASLPRRHDSQPPLGIGLPSAPAA